MKRSAIAAALLLAAGHTSAAGQAATGPDEVRRLVGADRYADARAALRAWWGAAGDTATGDRRAAALYLRAVLTDSLDAAERDLLRVAVEHPLAPDADDALLRLAHVRLVRGDSAGAAGHLERLAADHPQSPHRSAGLALLAALRPTARPSGSTASAPPSPPQGARAPERAPASAAATRPPAPRTDRFTVEVSSQRSVAAASELRDALRAKGFTAFLVMVGDDATVRVRVGDFPTRDAAAPMATRLRRAGYRPTVVPVGG